MQNLNVEQINQKIKHTNKYKQQKKHIQQFFHFPLHKGAKPTST